VVVVLLVSCGLFFGGRSHASNGNPGRTAYFKYCSSCHGFDGRGKGVVAPSLRVAPPDLTLLAKRQGGKFPHDEVKSVIDGRTAIAAHGSSEMPVWGAVLGKERTYETPEAHVRSQLQLLTDYLASIQTR
jgi:mono/diheme cytochrome c family protein